MQFRQIPVKALLGVGLLLGALAYSFDPASEKVDTFDGELLESGAPGRIRSGTTSVHVRLTGGGLVVADAPANLMAAPAGTPVRVARFRTLLFGRSAYVVESAVVGR